MVWDTHAPMGLGRPFRYVLERMDHGVRIRNLSGNFNEVLNNQTIKVDSTKVDKGTAISLNAKSQLTVEFKRLVPVPPAYAPGPALQKGLRLGQLFAYAGVRRTMISTSPVHSAYVAYARNKPVFALYQNPDGFKVKALLNGVRLKLKGQKPTAGKPGETWHLTSEQLITATMSRGWYWWRFNLIQPPVGLLGRPKATLEDQESKSFKKYLIVMALFFFAAMTALFFWKAATPDAEPEKPIPPEVKVEIKLKPKVPTALTEHTKPVRQKKNAAPSKEAVIALPKPAENPVQKASRESQANADSKPNVVAAKTPAKANLPKPIDAAKSDSKNAAQLAQARSDAKAAKQAARAEADKQKKFQKAQEVSNQLKAFSGLSGKLVNDNVLKTVNQSNDGNKPVFEGSGGNPAMGKTEIKPVFNGSNERVSGIGGGALNGTDDGGASGSKNGKSGNSFGYGKSGNNTSLGKGGSYVSVQTAGVTIDEGLSMDEVGKVIHDHMDRIRYCHDAGLLQDAKAEGKLVLDFKIDPTGTVESASVQSSSLPTDTDIGECVKNNLITWKFPKPHGGVHVSVSYPFLFKTLSRD